MNVGQKEIWITGEDLDDLEPCTTSSTTEAKVKSYEPSGQLLPELIPVSVAWSD